MSLEGLAKGWDGDRVPSGDEVFGGVRFHLRRVVDLFDPSFFLLPHFEPLNLRISQPNVQPIQSSHNPSQRSEQQKPVELSLCSQPPLLEPALPQTLHPRWSIRGMSCPLLVHPLLDPDVEHQSNWHVRSKEKSDREEDEEGVQDEDGEDKPAEGELLGGWDDSRDHEGESDGSEGDEGGDEGGVLEEEEERVDDERGVDYENLGDLDEG